MDLFGCVEHDARGGDVKPASGAASAGLAPLLDDVLGGCERTAADPGAGEAVRAEPDGDPGDRRRTADGDPPERRPACRC